MGCGCSYINLTNAESLDCSFNSSAHWSTGTYLHRVVLQHQGSTLSVWHPWLPSAFGLCPCGADHHRTSVNCFAAAATSDFEFRVPRAALCFGHAPSLRTGLCYYLLAPLLASAAAAAFYCCCLLLLLPSAAVFHFAFLPLFCSFLLPFCLFYSQVSGTLHCHIIPRD